MGCVDRLGLSENLGNDATDLSLYRTFAAGVHLRPPPVRLIAVYVEGVAAPRHHRRRCGNTAFLAYPSAGVRVIPERLFGESAATTPP